MATTVPADPAFPTTVNLAAKPGLEKREFIASRILTGILAGSPIVDASQGDINKKMALKAVEMTDLLIQALNGTLKMP